MQKFLSLAFVAVLLTAFSGCQSCDGLLPGCGDTGGMMPRLGLFGKHAASNCDTCSTSVNYTPASGCSTCNQGGLVSGEYSGGAILEGNIGSSGSNCNCNNSSGTVMHSGAILQSEVINNGGASGSPMLAPTLPSAGPGIGGGLSSPGPMRD